MKAWIVIALLVLLSSCSLQGSVRTEGPATKYVDPFEGQTSEIVEILEIQGRFEVRLIDGRTILLLKEFNILPGQGVILRGDNGQTYLCLTESITCSKVDPVLE